MDEWFQHWFDEDYERLYAHRDAEEARLAVTLACRQAPEFLRGPVLDLGCGSGRHLKELRRFNPLAFGLDLSRHLLQMAPAELRGSLLRGDMRHLPLRPASLNGVTLWFTPFGYFSDESNGRLLQELRACLVPGGVLVLDFFNAYEVRRTLVAEEMQERPDLRVHIQRSLEGARVIKRMHLERLDSGDCREVVESVRLYEPEELVALAREAGLQLRESWGNYYGDSFDPQISARWIGLFVRP